jgi:hypothetical protein
MFAAVNESGYGAVCRPAAFRAPMSGLLLYTAQGNRVGSSRSVVQHTRSAKAIAALSVCRECPSRERAA